MIARKAATSSLRVLHHAVLVLGVIVFATPLLWLFATSLKTDEQIVDVSSMVRMLVPNPIRWSNYPEALQFISYSRALLNTILATALSVWHYRALWRRFRLAGCPGQDGMLASCSFSTR